MSPDSNKADPAFVDYAKNTMADVIGIFWHLHKARMVEGLPFSVSNEKGIAADFDPEFQYTFALRPRPFDIIQSYASGIDQSLNNTWTLMLEEFGLRKPHPLPNRRYGPPLSDAQKDIFCGQYVHTLIERAQDQWQDRSKVKFRMRDVAEVISAAFNTGSHVPTQLTAVLRKDLTEPIIVEDIVTFSKVSIDHIQQGRLEIGLPDQFDRHIPRKYTLYDDSHRGLDKERLLELGLGNAVGCPAALLLSTKSESYLRDKGVSVSRKSSLREFAEMVPGEFKRSVGDWYEGLSDANRAKYLDETSLDILSGETYRSAKEDFRRRIAEGASCPFGRKERD